MDNHRHINIKTKMEFTENPYKQKMLLQNNSYTTTSNAIDIIKVTSRLKIVAFNHYGGPKNVPKNREEKKKLLLSDKFLMIIMKLFVFCSKEHLI